MNDASVQSPAGTRALISAISGNIAQVMSGQSGSIRNILAAFLAGGHVLLEDNPGTGKKYVFNERDEASALKGYKAWKASRQPVTRTKKIEG